MSDGSIIFSTDHTNYECNSRKFSLDDLTASSLWVAWRNERRINQDGTSEITKVPYRSATQKARSDTPSTWVTAETAASTSIGLMKTGCWGGGIGICLGIVDAFDGYRLGGIDLDCCFVDGVLADWTLPIMKRFPTYTEVSPSGNGSKLFFLYRSAQWLEQIKPLLGTAKTGRQFKRHADHNHPPGIEMYLRARFFAVTGDLLEGCPSMLRVVEPDDLRWLVNDYGPKFKGKNPSIGLRPTLPSTKTVETQTMKHGSDSSRSGRAFNWMRVFHRMGLTYVEARDRLLALTEDPSVAIWAATKGMANDQYELRRVYYRSQPIAESIDDRLGEMARVFAAESRET